VKIQFYCPRWGSEHLSWELFTQKVKQSGYDGVEFNFPLGNQAEVDVLLQALQHRGLELIGLHGDTVTPDFSRHREEFQARLSRIAAVRPRFINSHTGRDWFLPEQNKELLALAKEISARTGVPIYHETHRSKFSFAASVTAQFLKDDPDLRLVADFSHWCNVSESLLEDQATSLALAIERSDHIHARVGHSQGPQVTDPRAPEWAQALAAHLRWWDSIVACHRARGTPVLTVTPEFGPLPYMPSLPHTNVPVANQWEINVHMMNLLKARWSQPVEGAS